MCISLSISSHFRTLLWPWLRCKRAVKQKKNEKKKLKEDGFCFSPSCVAFVCVSACACVGTSVEHVPPPHVHKAKDTSHLRLSDDANWAELRRVDSRTEVIPLVHVMARKMEGTAHATHTTPLARRAKKTKSHLRHHTFENVPYPRVPEHGTESGGSKAQQEKGKNVEKRQMCEEKKKRRRAAMK